MLLQCLGDPGIKGPIELLGQQLNLLAGGHHALPSAKRPANPAREMLPEGHYRVLGSVMFRSSFPTNDQTGSRRVGGLTPQQGTKGGSGSKKNLGVS